MSYKTVIKRFESNIAGVFNILEFCDCLLIALFKPQSHRLFTALVDIGIIF